MKINRILKGMWAGTIVVPPAPEHEFLELVRSLFPVHATCLIDSAPEGDKIVVMSDSDHILTELPLSDALAVELDLIVPEQSLVFIVPAQLLDPDVSALAQSKALGVAAAMAVVHTAEQGLIDVQREIRTIRALAHACADLSVTARLERSRIFSEAFRESFDTELESLIGWPVMAQIYSTDESGSVVSHSVLFDYMESPIARKRRVDCTVFADMAMHLGASDRDGTVEQIRPAEGRINLG